MINYKYIMGLLSIVLISVISIFAINLVDNEKQNPAILLKEVSVNGYKFQIPKDWSFNLTPGERSVLNFEFKEKPYEISIHLLTKKEKEADLNTYGNYISLMGDLTKRSQDNIWQLSQDTKVYIGEDFLGFPFYEVYIQWTSDESINLFLSEILRDIEKINNFGTTTEKVSESIFDHIGNSTSGELNYIIEEFSLLENSYRVLAEVSYWNGEEIEGISGEVFESMYSVQNDNLKNDFIEGDYISSDDIFSHLDIRELFFLADLDRIGHLEAVGGPNFHSGYQNEHTVCTYSGMVEQYGGEQTIRAGCIEL